MNFPRLFSRVLVISALSAGLVAAPASAAPAPASWKCEVGMPLAEAGVNTAKKMLESTTAELPKAEQRAAAAQAALTAATAAAREAKAAAATAPNDTNLATKAREAANAASSAKAAAKLTSSEVKAIKSSLPRLSRGLAKAIAKLDKLKASCK